MGPAEGAWQEPYWPTRRPASPARLGLSFACSRMMSQCMQHRVSGPALPGWRVVTPEPCAITASTALFPCPAAARGCERYRATSRCGWTVWHVPSAATAAKTIQPPYRDPPMKEPVTPPPIEEPKLPQHPARDPQPKKPPHRDPPVDPPEPGEPSPQINDPPAVSRAIETSGRAGVGGAAMSAPKKIHATSDPVQDENRDGPL